LRTLDPAGLPKSLLSVYRTQSRDAPVRRMALEELARMDTGDDEVVRAFVGALDDPDQAIHRAALAGLNRASPEQALAHVCLALRSAVPGERVAAILNLERLGPTARPALPLCRLALRDADPLVRAQAAGALLSLGEEASQAILAALRDG